MSKLLTLIRQSLRLTPYKATLTAIFIAESAGQPMKRMTTAHAILNRGLEGDRYYTETGHWKPVEACQVTLISTHDLAQASKDRSLNFSNGSHRRNLVIDGLKTKTLEGKVFRIGDAVFSYDKPRPPCGYLNKIEGKGMAKALNHNSGVCIRVLQSGKLTTGDELAIIDPASMQVK